MKVIKHFQDKHTKKYYRVGSDYKGNRVDELQSKGFLYKEPKKKQPKKDGSKKGDK